MITHEIHCNSEEPGPNFRFRQVLLQEPNKSFLCYVIRDIGIAGKTLQISKEGWI